MPNENDLSLYDYPLPEHLIAQEPVSPRDSSRLLVLHRAEGRWEHRLFKNLSDYLDSNDLIVANNTRVLKARLLGYRIREESGQRIQGGKVEFVLLEKVRDRVWEGLFHASAKYLPGLQFEIPFHGGLESGLHSSDDVGAPEVPPLRGTLIRGASESPSGTVVAEFDRDPVEAGFGELPLPHYIGRSVQAQDENQYQTVYAKHLGSAAAPTAGLHFTDRTMKDLAARGVNWKEVTLHVGVGTFRPVKGEDIARHVMHEEQYEISPETAGFVNEWKWGPNRGQHRILAVGTTSVRTLESAWTPGPKNEGNLQSGVGRTSLFIRPGIDYKFRVVDRLLTNFHLPRSTLLMLVSAFAGRELTLAAYHEAIREGYRFFSYGDAMLVL